MALSLAFFKVADNSFSDMLLLEQFLALLKLQRDL